MDQTPGINMRRVSAKDFAYSEIKHKIINGDLEPGQQIAEETLTEQLEISRTPLREALQRLEIEELVVRQLNGRLKVAPISIQEVEEIFLVRSMLEGIIAAQATTNATESDIENLKYITRMIKETSEEGRLEEVIEYGSRFHNYLYELSKNKTVIKMLSQINDHVHRYRRLVPLVDKADNIKKTAEEHQLILSCIAHKDPKGAELAMRKHIQNSLETAIKAISLYKKNKIG